MAQKKTSKNVLIGVAAAAAITATALLLRNTSGPVSPQKTTPIAGTAPATFHNLPPEGIGGDPALNRQKNRWAQPTSYNDVTIDQVMSFSHGALSDAGEKDRSKWSSSAIAEAHEHEDQGVRLEGYILAAKESGLESCNGKNDSLHDFHVWLGASADMPKEQGMIVEPTPFYKEHNTGWTLAAIKKLIKTHTKVRISGWILWDQEHSEEVGKSRGTLWEIHPVTKFEMMENNSWVDLHDPGQNLP